MPLMKAWTTPFQARKGMWATLCLPALIVFIALLGAAWRLTGDVWRESLSLNMILPASAPVSTWRAWEAEFRLER